MAVIKTPVRLKNNSCTKHSDAFASRCRIVICEESTRLNKQLGRAVNLAVSRVTSLDSKAHEKGPGILQIRGPCSTRCRGSCQLNPAIALRVVHAHQARANRRRLPA